jgi:hypothetical protein
LLDCGLDGQDQLGRGVLLIEADVGASFLEDDFAAQVAGDVRRIGRGVQGENNVVGVGSRPGLSPGLRQHFRRKQSINVRL